MSQLVDEIQKQRKHSLTTKVHSWQEVEQMCETIAESQNRIIRTVSAQGIDDIIPAILIAKYLDAQFCSGRGDLHFSVFADVNADACFFMYDYEDEAKAALYKRDCPYVESIPVEMDGRERRVKFPWN